MVRRTSTIHPNPSHISAIRDRQNSGYSHRSHHAQEIVVEIERTTLNAPAPQAPYQQHQNTLEYRVTAPHRYEEEEDDEEELVDDF